MIWDQGGVLPAMKKDIKGLMSGNVGCLENKSVFRILISGSEGKKMSFD